MFSIGTSELGIIVGVIAAIIIASVLSRRGGMRGAGSALVLRKFRVNEAAPDGIIIDIDGRSSGLISWFLAVLGFDAICTFRLTASEITSKSSSLFGQTHIVTPLTGIAHTEGGYSKPIGYLIVGGLLILTGLYRIIFESVGSISFIILLIGAGFLVAYWLLKKMAIVIETCGGAYIGLSYKRSVIENIPVDIKMTLEAIRLVNQRVLKAQSLRPTATVEAPQKALGICTNCGYKNSPEDIFCSQCGKKMERVQSSSPI